MDASNNLIAFYVYDGVGLVAKVTSANEYYFYHYDGLGSTVAITDSTAQIVNAYAYSPYGLVGAQETIANPFTYVGRFGVMAESHGLYYMRARYYDPEVGRFINKDPIGYAGGMNLYAYVFSNPVSLVDPLGLEVRVYSSDGWGIPGLNHAFVYSTETDRYRGMAGSSGVNMFGDGRGDLNSPYNVVEDLNGLSEKEFMDLIDRYPGWNKGCWPLGKDCHEQLEEAFK